MIEAELAYAFTAGMVATVNPCGFALLPAYLSYFLGLEGAEEGTRTSMVRALSVALVVTAGFVLVFGGIGLVTTHLSLSIYRHLPWATMIIGAALVALGVAMLRGFQLTVRLPKVNASTAGRQLSSMFLFGVSYAVASLSCTLALFLPLMTRSFGSQSVVSGLAVFVTYAAGMGVLLAAITLALAAAKGAMVAKLRRIQPHVNRVAGALLVAAGAYLVYYGYWSRGVFAGDAPPAGPVAWVESASAGISNWISSVGGLRLGVLLAAAVVVTLILVLGQRRTAPPKERTPTG